MDSIDRKLILAAMLILAVFVSIKVAPNQADAAPVDPSGQYNSMVQRIEHLGLAVDMDRCVRLAPGPTMDAGPYLSGEPDASFSPGPDAATFGPGEDAATWKRPDSSVGPRPYPSADLNYVCVSSDYKSCLTSGGRYPNNCGSTFVVPADQMVYPVTFLLNRDGGAPAIRGMSPVGQADLECCPVVTNILKGR